MYLISLKLQQLGLGGEVIGTIFSLIVYLYFDVYKSCIPIISITSEIGT